MSDKSNKKGGFGKLIITGGIILCLILACSMFYIWINISSLMQETDMREQEIKKYSKMLGADVQSAIKEKESLIAQLESLHNELKNSLSESYLKECASATPLSFKKMLFDKQEQIARNAKSSSIILPENLGFEEYKLKVPDTAMASVLMSELCFLDEVSAILNVSKVKSIKSIEMPHAITSISYKAKTEESLFKALSMQLTIKTDLRGLNSFLVNLAKSPRNFIIQQIGIKRTDDKDELLIADINIISLEL